MRRTAVQTGPGAMPDRKYEMAMAQKQRSSRPGEEARNIKAGHVTRQVHVQGFL